METTDLQSFTGADIYCKYKYGTSLASIHSEQDMEEAVSLCSKISKFGDLPCWIGLSETNISGQLQWTDGTSFDYGSELASYPWKSDQSLSTNQCVKIESWGWIIDTCEDTDSAYALCNAPSEICDESQWIYTVSSSVSNDSVPSSDIILHPDPGICNVSRWDWLGDGWCDQNLYGYNTAACGYDLGDCCPLCCSPTVWDCSAAFNCMEPSCQTDALELDDWEWSTRPCEVQSEAETETVAVIGRKQWENINGVLLIDFVFNIYESKQNGDVGIVLYFDQSSCDKYY